MLPAENLTPEGRIESLDVVRGLAVLGILLVNAAAFALPIDLTVIPSIEPYQPGTIADWLAVWGVHVLAEGKFVSLFSMLFGVSLFLVGGGSPDDVNARRAGRARLSSRLFWLALLGACHGALLWFGDILLTYAIAGFIMLPTRHWGAKRLLIVGTILFAGWLLLLVAASLWVMSTFSQSGELAGMFPMPTPADLEAEVQAMRGPFQAAFEQNMTHWLETGLAILPGFMIPTVGLMMVGLGLFKSGYFHGHWSAGHYRLTLFLAGVALVLISLQTYVIVRSGYDPVALGLWAWIPNVILAPLVSLGYASALLLALKAGRLAKLTASLSGVGRLALTNYISQTLIMTTLFLGWRGFGLYGELDRAALLGICMLVWAAQIVFSRWYLARFEQGPLEWAWRCLTDGKRYAFQRKAR